jgi:aminoglycoside phosphotransferase (APT) family kinase protein
VSIQPDRLTDCLASWARAHFGPDALVTEVARMPGHSSYTFGFRVDADGGIHRLVLRTPANRTRRQADALVRQIPLLRMLTRRGIPVPPVRDGGPGPTWFGGPYTIVDRMPGSTWGDAMADSEAAGPTNRTALFEQAVDTLAAVHAVDVRAELPDWGESLSGTEMADRWRDMLERYADGDSARQGREVHRALHRRLPKRVEGLVHGDFYSNNWLFDGSRLSAVLDWEAAHIGPPAADLGWLAMMYDPESWDVSCRPDLKLSPEPEKLLERYEATIGAAVADLRWYRALAGFRLAALTAYFVAHHRDGTRPDPVWETVNRSAPHMLARAAQVARSR